MEATKKELMTEHIINFVNLWQERIDEQHSHNTPDVPPETLEVSYGKKYAKVINNYMGQQRSVSAFIDLETGDVLKPASWSGPAPHARGNVFSEDQGMEAVDSSGYIKYLK